MVIMTAKVSKRKLLVLALAVAVIVVLLVLCLKNAGSGEPQAPEQAARPTEIRTNEDRLAFLQGYGWTVCEEPVKTQEVRVPEEPGDVFLRYNELQLAQGYDLTEYAGKTVKRYVYEIENYPGGGECKYFATLLIYRNQVIGGDISAGAANGVMHGFQMPG